MCQEYPKNRPPKKCAEILNLLVSISRRSRYEDIPKPPLKIKGFQSSEWSFGRWLSIFRGVSTKELPDIRYTVLLMFSLKGFFQDGIQQEWVSVESHNQPVLFRRSGAIFWNLGMFDVPLFRGADSPNPYSEPKSTTNLSQEMPGPPGHGVMGWGIGMYVVKILG